MVVSQRGEMVGSPVEEVGEGGFLIGEMIDSLKVLVVEEAVEIMAANGEPFPITSPEPATD